MAKKKFSRPIKIISIVSLVLVLLEVLFIGIFGKPKEILTPGEALDAEVRSLPGLTERERLQMKIQMAIAHYMSTHKNVPPQSLQDLVSEYFQNVPVDPQTNKPFEYKVENGRGLVGGQDQILASINTKINKNDKQNPAQTDTSGELTEEQKKALIASLTEADTEPEFIYDSTNKRDPFRPFDFAPKLDMAGKTPLERYSIGQLKLTAVLDLPDGPIATVENSAGKGFNVRKGTKIGPNSGEVVEIHKDRLVIVETTFDFTGDKKSRTLEMRLRTKDQEEAASLKANTAN